MKKSLKYILVAVFATMFCAPAFADKDPKEAIKTGKSIVVDPTTGDMRLRLETFVTGDGENDYHSETTVKPMDVVLVLDKSQSMDRYGSIRRVKLGSAKTARFAEQCYYNKSVMKNIKFWNSSSNQAQEVTVINNNGQYVFRRGNNNYTGDIYVTKLDALKIGVKTFVEIVKSNSEENDAEHKISVITFGSSASVLLNLTDNYSDVIDKVNGIETSGTTQVNSGFLAAKNELETNARKGDESTKAIVFFTDGEPGGSSYSGTVANDALATSLELKQSGVKVYSLATITDGVDNINRIKTFLYLMSSHNTTVGSMPTTFTGYSNGKYFILANNASELRDAFESVTDDIDDGGTDKTDYELVTTKTVLRDIITPSFEIPEGGQVSFKVASIKAFATETLSDNVDVTQPENWQAERDTTMANAVSQRVDPETGRTYVDIKGFNFNKNWVGYMHKKVDGHETKKWLRGNKLVMYIDIEPSAEHEGGAVQTNAPGSGIVIDGDEVVPFDLVPIKDYECPDPITVRQVNLTIKKSGLQPGESVVYTVTRSNDSSFKRTVVLTAGADGKAEGKVKVDAWPNANKTSMYTYTVTEDNTWAYAYKTTTAAEGAHTLYDASYNLTNVFTFGQPEASGKSEGTNKRGEDAKNNAFTSAR